MKESTSRKEKNKEERLVDEKQKQEYSESQLKLVQTQPSAIQEKKVAMANKIWDDIIENYSYVEDHSDHKKMEVLPAKAKSFPTSLAEVIDLEQESVSIDSFTSEISGMTVEHLKFTKAIQLSQSFVLIVNRDGLIEYANPHFQNVSGYTIDELQGREFGFLISDLASHDEYQQILQALKAGTSWKGELVNTKKNGEWYIFTAKISPVKIGDSTAADFIIVGHDVTSFRETEIKLEQAVEEKSILLSELHHRVKNNLAIISGIMQLQAFDEKDDELKTKLFSSVGRVKTLATMHELLYESSSFTMLEFGKNIHKIVSTISEMFEKEHSKVQVEYDLEPIILNINQAHPCALILNEVLTNSYKKAATEADILPKIDIRLIAFGKKIMIEIKDNIGSLPDGYTSQHQPLSMQLIKTLVRQLNGSFNYLTDDYGTLFTLAFEKEHLKGAGNVRLS